jgi:ectoine hydroxylase-related dioxygenase (phytanoyl-CoA dioxygenase family)
MATTEQREQFEADGFLIVENFINPDTVEALRSRFEKLFAGVFDTGVQPDEWNWREGRDSNQLTRQICNGWKADHTIAATVLRSDIGQMCATLRGWPGSRINQDNVIWKPPGSAALGFHQDESYQSWIVPAEMMTCWMTLDDTKASQGTIEYVRGSHLWPLSAPISQFHAPDDPLADMQAAAAGMEVDLVPIEVPAGSAVFHHGRTWHGSRGNTGTGMRRSVVSHCMSSEAVFHSQHTSPVYSRYKRHGDSSMDESFFPVLWHQNGYRTGWL